MPFEAVIRNERDALEDELEQPIEGEHIEQLDDPMPEARADQPAREQRPAQEPDNEPEPQPRPRRSFLAEDNNEEIVASERQQRSMAHEAADNENRAALQKLACGVAPHTVFDLMGDLAIIKRNMK
jgi:hypothetical protein